MKLETINKFLNLFLLCLVIQTPTVQIIVDGEGLPTRLFISTIFRRGYVKNWPHIRLITWLGF